MNNKPAIEAIHQRLINHFGPTKNLSILDYGCGKGGLTKILLNSEQRPAQIYAVDNDAASIETVNSAFAPQIAQGILKTGIISDPKQLIGYAANGIFCHNVLELVENKEQFVTDLYNLFAADGILILSHMDFDSMIWNSSFKELTRKLVHHFADTTQGWMPTSDGQIGRKIPGILSRTGIQNFSFEAWRWQESTFQEGDYGFVMASAVIETAKKNFDPDELQVWKADLIERAQNHDYFFAVDIDVARIISAAN